jgi:hypothetical protein
MQREAKGDVIAAASITLMFLGAFILTMTGLGLLLIGGGAVAMALLIMRSAAGRS